MLNLIKENKLKNKSNLEIQKDCIYKFFEKILKLNIESYSKASEYESAYIEATNERVPGQKYTFEIYYSSNSSGYEPTALVAELVSISNEKGDKYELAYHFSFDLIFKEDKRILEGVLEKIDKTVDEYLGKEETKQLEKVKTLMNKNASKYDFKLEKEASGQDFSLSYKKEKLTVNVDLAFNNALQVEVRGLPFCVDHQFFFLNEMDKTEHKIEKLFEFLHGFETNSLILGDVNISPILSYLIETRKVFNFQIKEFINPTTNLVIWDLNLQKAYSDYNATNLSLFVNKGTLTLKSVYLMEEYVSTFDEVEKALNYIKEIDSLYPKENQ